jgi:hypothetical protein
MHLKIHETHKLATWNGARYCRLCLANDQYGSRELLNLCYPKYTEDGKPLFPRGFAMHCDDM